MKQIFKFIITTLVTSIMVSFTEPNPVDFTLIPPSPEVSALLKYQEVPVNNFSGLPQIVIPIFEVKEGTLTVPITAQYHGGGIRVYEQDANLGLGWSLNAGGSVSRNINGLPDDLNYPSAKGLYNLTKDQKNLREYIRNKHSEYDPCLVSEIQDANLRKINASNEDYEKGCVDMANDIYNINALGLSATFIFDDQRHPVISSSSNIKIMENNMQSFTIVDENDVTYYFDKQEFTRYRIPPAYLNHIDSINYISAWHLTKIKNYEGDSIIFRYNLKPKRIKYTVLGSGEWSTSNYTHIDKLFNFKKSWASNEIIYFPETIQSIESSSTITRFYYDDEQKRITSIKIHTNDDQQKIIKNISFDYNIAFKNEFCTNCYLKSINEIAQSGTISIAKMNYNDEYNEYSFGIGSIDHGGYNNGANNYYLFPPLNFPIKITYGADRKVNPKKCLFGSLKTIHYPTGGFVNFNWEPNEFGYVKTTQVKDSVIYIESKSEQMLCGLKLSEVLKIPELRISSTSSYTLNLTNYFKHVEEWLVDWKWYHADHTDFKDYTYPRVVFQKIDENNHYLGDSSVFYIDKKTIGTREIPIDLRPGKYEVTLKSPRGFDGADEGLLNRFTEDGSYDFGKVYLITTSTTGKREGMKKDYWPGLRIRSIVSYSSNSDSIEKRYEYGIAHDPRISEGVIPMRPKYYSYYDYFGIYPLSGTAMIAETFRIHRLSSNGLYRTPINLQGVEYPYVVEQYRIGGINEEPGYGYSIRSHYSSLKTLDYCDYNNTRWLGCQPPPAQMWTSRSHFRGNLLSKEYTDNYQQNIVKKQNYSYNIFEDTVSHKFATNFFQIADLTNYGGGKYSKDYSIGEYELIPYNKIIKQEEVLERCDGDTLKSIVNYTYFYDKFTTNLDYKLVRSEKTTDSQGRTIEKFYTYYKRGLRFLNQKETEIAVSNGIVISAKRMEYNPVSNKLSKVFTLNERGISGSFLGVGSKETTSQMKNKITKLEYSYRYDSISNNLAEIRFNGMPVVSYLWGYRGTHPIVEIRDVAYDDLLNKLPRGYRPETLYQPNTYYTQYFSELFEIIRNAFPNNEVTTMTYHWLIGVSAATDSRGVTTHFTYDDFGRLSGVKDFNEYFIRKYDYHYKTN